MTRIALLLLVALAGFNAGCKSLLGKGETAEPKPTGEIPARTAEELVGYLNQQAGQLRSISYKDVSVTASENGKDMPRLGDCSLDARQPRDFRLVCGTLATSNEVDIGSNDREFWMYVKRMDPPYNFVYCRHDDFARGAGQRLPIPFDTGWIMQALGMAPFPAGGQYSVSINKQHRKYMLEENTTTSSGVPVKKVIAFNADHDYGKKPVVCKHWILDAQNQPLASAEVVSAKTVRVGQAYVQVPSEVLLEWPQQKFRMKLVLDGERVNEDYGQRAAALFSRPQIRGANPIDLATYTFNPTSRSQAPDRRRARP